MKLLLLNYEYPPLGGGAANATAYLLREYSGMPDLQVHLVTSAIGASIELERLGKNIFIHRVPIGKKKTNLHHQTLLDLIRYTWHGYFFARKILKKEKDFDVIHAFFSVPCGFQALLLSLEFRLPYLVSLRGADVPGYSERFSFLYFFLKPFIRAIWKRAAAVIANSQGLRALALKTDTRALIEVIPNGIAIQQYFPKEDARPKERCIITPGASRVTRRKGLEYLIQAVARLQEEYPHILLKIMGEGSDKERLEEMARTLGLEAHVEFLGRIAHEETVRHYQEASLFVLPSQNEGMSNAMLEALASGLPIIATDTGGSQELVKVGENGFLVKMRSPEDIAEKLRRFLDNPELIQKFGTASRKRAEELSWTKVAAAYADVYKSTVKNTR